MTRVFELVSAERRRLERQRYEEEREAREAAQAAAPTSIPTGSTTNPALVPGAESGGTVADGTMNGGPTLGASPGVLTDKPAPTGPMPEIERGLCVVCQDEEATLAVVDCGHLCMCSRESSASASASAR